MEYTVISHVKREVFERMVNDRLAEGWELYGPTQVTIYPDDCNVLLTQAMVRPQYRRDALAVEAAMRQDAVAGFPVSA